MLAWVHQSLASERELLVSLFGDDKSSGVDADTPADMPSIAELLDRVLESICKPLTVRFSSTFRHWSTPLEPQSYYSGWHAVPWRLCWTACSTASASCSKCDSHSVEIRSYRSADELDLNKTADAGVLSLAQLLHWVQTCFESICEPVKLRCSWCHADIPPSAQHCICQQHLTQAARSCLSSGFACASYAS